MMRFLTINEEILNTLLEKITKNRIVEIFKFSQSFLKQDTLQLFNSKYYDSIKKQPLVDYLKQLILTTDFIEKFDSKIKVDEHQELYAIYIWEETKLAVMNKNEIINNDSIFFLEVLGSSGWNGPDSIGIEKHLRTLLQHFTETPQYFNIIPIKNEKIEPTYSNENDILHFITLIESMLKSGVVKMNTSGNAPLKSTINIIKSASSIKEFYPEKKMDEFAIYMLIETTYKFFKNKNKFKPKSYATLYSLITEVFSDSIQTTISKYILNHLKGVKLGWEYYPQRELFNTILKIINTFPRDGAWVGFENIYKYIKYHELSIDINHRYKINDFIFKYDIHDELNVSFDYDMLYGEPLIKGIFYYLAALGVVDISYDKPVSTYDYCAEGEEYISPWDGLEYVRLNKLGLYAFGFSENYTFKEEKKSSSTLKFDEYKPIVTVDKNNPLMRVKLEAFAEEIEDNRFLLNSRKIFKDCATFKDLEFKMNSFFTQIEPNPPKVFNDYFDYLKSKANILTKETTKIVINLKNDRDLLNLFMNNKKIQEITIKAEGLRIIVEKKDLSKLTRIVKENGFFLEF